MKKLIIINQEQFGYHTDTYYYCKYLKYDFGIIYICWDHGFSKVGMDGVRVVYVSRKGNMLFRTTRFLQYALGHIRDKSSIVFVKYFKGVSLALRILKPRHCFVLDIRTGSVHSSSIVRRAHDMRLKFELPFFRHVTVISRTLAEKLGIEDRAHILPIAADIISSAEKSFDGFHLLYVGTLYNRNIDITIRGFKQFYEKVEDRADISYTIIGDGLNNEAMALKDLSSRYGLSGVVKVTGFIPHTQLMPWFDTSNVGVSYVPITDYYDCQPPTKTFEYLLSGMPVIATNTSEHQKVITQQNGVLTGDTPEDFYAGLKAIYEKRDLFDSAKIRNDAMEFTWEKIVRDNLGRYLADIENKRVRE